MVYKHFYTKKKKTLSADLTYILQTSYTISWGFKQSGNREKAYKNKIIAFRAYTPKWTLQRKHPYASKSLNIAPGPLRGLDFSYDLWKQQVESSFSKKKKKTIIGTRATWIQQDGNSQCIGEGTINNWFVTMQDKYKIHYYKNWGRPFISSRWNQWTF